MTYILGLLNYWGVSFERECQNNHSYTQLSHYFLSISGISNGSIIVSTDYFFLYLRLILAAIPISYYFSSYHRTFSLFSLD